SAADSAIETVRLVESADTITRKLSAGQRRRLALAVALARQPRLLLLDEPHAGLDADARTVVDEVVRDAAAGGAAVLIASHDLEHTRPLAHREVVLTRGRTTASGAVEAAVPDVPALGTAAGGPDPLDVEPARTA